MQAVLDMGANKSQPDDLLTAAFNDDEDEKSDSDREGDMDTKLTILQVAPGLLFQKLA